MIERYTRPEMAAIWQDENRFRIWLDIEILAMEAMVRKGWIPKDALARVRKKASFDVARINEIEKKVKHDVIAFLTSVAEYIGDDSRFLHLGMTSSDVLDTAFAVQMRQALALLIREAEAVFDVLKARALEHRRTVMIGRTHGIHAEPVTFGWKMALWADEVRRDIVRLARARDVISVGKISGAVGTFANIDPSVEEYVCRKLRLSPAPASTQVIQRDRHAEVFAALAIVASSLDKFATEIRHLQRTEVLEAEEFFSAGQKGSSAMPHKRNPVGCENLSGLARVVRGNLVAALENVAQYPEGSCFELRQGVAKSLGVEPDMLIFGAGADEARALHAQAAVDGCDAAVQQWLGDGDGVGAGAGLHLAEARGNWAGRHAADKKQREGGPALTPPPAWPRSSPRARSRSAPEGTRPGPPSHRVPCARPWMPGTRPCSW